MYEQLSEQNHLWRGRSSPLLSPLQTTSEILKLLKNTTKGLLRERKYLDFVIDGLIVEVFNCFSKLKIFTC